MYNWEIIEVLNFESSSVPVFNAFRSPATHTHDDTFRHIVEYFIRQYTQSGVIYMHLYVYVWITLVHM